MRRKTTVLFVQFPQLDNDVTGPHENLMMAAACLQYAAERSGEDRYYDFARLPVDVANADNAHTVESIADLRPGVIAFTAYLWNVERTLRLARLIRQRLPLVKIAVGGPEVAFPHPFLLRSRAVDVAVAGEGEVVFPLLLRAFRLAAPLDFRTVATLTDGGYRIGRFDPPAANLGEAVPPPGYRDFGPDRRGMAYLETSRGCPMRCAYCRYPHLRRTLSFLAPSDVIRRLRALKEMGAREIRFVDPSFNAHPRFLDILKGLAEINRSGSLKFFAELNAERLIGKEADLLARAHFTDIEVGLQSRDPNVLRAIRRPSDLKRLDAGVRLLARRNIRVTLDVMYGLPLQTESDVRRSLKCALGFRGVNVQSLQTLLIPGTEMRRRRREWGLESTPLPPYGVTATPRLPPSALARIEAYVAKHPRLRSDLPTPAFVGRRLGALFSEKVVVDADRLAASTPVPGRESRRAFLIRGHDLFGRRDEIVGFVKRAIRQEPDILCQFVLAPHGEEPLDLFDDLIAAIRAAPSHLNDRYAALAGQGKIASRRLLVRLPAAGRFSVGWIQAVDRTLGAVFF